MSFETAKRITPESFNQEFQFMRRPSVRYPVKKETKQSVNISKETRERAAIKNAPIPQVPRFSYGDNGRIDQSSPIGQFLSAFA